MKLYLAALCFASLLLFFGTVLLGKPTNFAPSTGARPKPQAKSMLVRNFDALEAGYHEISGLFYDGISDRNLHNLLVEQRLGPTFSFTVGSVAYANLEPHGVMPVIGSAKPQILVTKAERHNSYVLIVPETTAWLEEIRQAAPQYIITGR